MMGDQFVVRCDHSGPQQGRNMNKLPVMFLFSVLFGSQDALNPRQLFTTRLRARENVDRASMKLFKDAYDASEDKNVIMSPLGVFMLLSLYSRATSRNSTQEIQHLMHFYNYNHLTETYEYLSEIFSAMDPKLLTLATQVCISDKYQLEEEFSSLATQRYHSEVTTLDFDNPQAAADSLNEWADRKSGGYIKNPMKPDTFSPDTVALLLNVIYFQGNWSYPFERNYTEMKFHISETESVMKPTMMLSEELLHGKNRALWAQVLRLPYKESDFSMLLVLPDDVGGLPTLLEKFARYGTLRALPYFDMTTKKVNLEMPKFEVRTKHTLKPILEKEGVSGIFTDEATGLVKGVGVKISDVFQEAFIKADEGGTTAAAFTSMDLVVRCTMLEDIPVMFRVDRPFLYVILHKHIELFFGTYTH